MVVYIVRTNQSFLWMILVHLTGSQLQWIEEEQHLPIILTPWYTAKQTSFGCPVKNASKPAEKDFTTKLTFEQISKLDPRLTTLVTGDTFPITFQMLRLKKSYDQPGYLCNLHAMHLVIKTYPDHFPEDNPMSRNEIYSRENWFRAWHTLKFYWLAHKKLAGAARTKNISRKEAIVPLYMDSAAASIDTTVDEATSYALFKQDEYNDFYNMETDGSISRTEKTAEEVEDENVREAEVFHAELNKTGDIQKEANRRVIEGKKVTRPLIKPEELTIWLEGLAKHLKQFTTTAKVVRGPEKNDPNEAPMFKESMEFSEILATVEGLSKSDQEQVTNGKKEFFELLEKMSSANYRDPNNIVIEGTNLKPYPHQVIDMAWLAEMEESAFGGSILASECGSGKTVVILLLVLMTSMAFFPTSYTTFAKRAMRIKKAYGKGKDVDGEVNYMSDENEIDDVRDEDEEMNDQLLKKYELGFSHYGEFGRLVPDEAHIIKNPCTLTADVIYKCQIKRCAEPSATPMINRIQDARGLLIQLLKEENAVSILPPLSDDEQVVKLHKAVDDGTPLHILCPKAFLAVGNQSNWDANAA
ncbi:hypothetical protein BTUL_0010g01150 [Botrytis tulipae]|uniref:SNF2 N-terminal domain-containing protein n=1 Tax=Botrytis tulipae TaxID=87230 RepID=A0A4Z1F1H3_9HELO|nr:hypothetical protein BTUL_0010g01150 [Botrytis tulipae]